MNRFAFLLLAACAAKTEAPPPAAAAAEPPPPPPIPEYAKALVGAMDTKANACEDFYRYACGGWMDATPLPADKPLWGKSFSSINEANLATTRAVLEKAAANPAGGDADWARLGNFYGSCMDEAAVDKSAAAALAPWVADIDKAKDLKAVMTLAGRMAGVGIPAFVGSDVYADFKDPSINILHMTQGGLGLPDRDYYLKTDDASKDVLAAYQAFVAEALVVAGVPAADAAKQAEAVVKLETAIAEAWVPRAELRDPERIYNKIDRAGLTKLTPKLPWESWLAGRGIAKDAGDINVEVPEVYKKLEGVLAKTDVKTLKSYLKWQLVAAAAPHMGQDVYAKYFAFYGQKLTGQKEPRPRWQRCVQTTEQVMGEITGKFFVQEKFAGESKDVALDMIKDIEDAFAAGLPKLAWMDDATRDRAKDKIGKINNKIGYPDVWRDYSALTIEPGVHTKNVLAAKAFEGARVAAKVSKPVDRKEWWMSPAMVNAYYDPTMNEMAFPAGILQAPFFSKDYPAAMNYGAIGMVMGHELTHGFDDSGRKFDGDGKMVEWWAPEVGAKFEERAGCVEKQYGEFTIAGLNVNGTLTLGENIADIGGYRSAYRAYKAAGAPPANVPGLTDDQLFFVAAAQSWCVVASPEIEKMRALSDSHSPAKYRVLGPLQNLPEFAEAFGCAEGTPMRPANSCEVW